MWVARIKEKAGRQVVQVVNQIYTEWQKFWGKKSPFWKHTYTRPI